LVAPGFGLGVLGAEGVGDPLVGTRTETSAASRRPPQNQAKQEQTNGASRGQTRLLADTTKSGGEPVRAYGGTADVVAYAREHGTSVRVIWPDGAQRG
jgi:hypothetical protein